MIDEDEARRIPVQISFSLPMRSLEREIHAAVEEEGWEAIPDPRPNEERSVGYGSLVLLVTLEIIGDVDDVLALGGRARTLARRVAEVVSGRERRRAETLVRVIYGPRNEVLAEVEVKAHKDD